jgi:Baseplate J-like protein
MPTNVITASGIQIESFAQIVNDIQNGTSSAPGFFQIYGPSINISSNSPDGQMINIFAVSKQNMLNLCVQIYNSFDPDQALGIALDNVSQYCGITRKGGLYTQVVVTVTVSQNLNLSGQDTSTPYTVQDGNGNQYQLITSASLTTGANNLNFQAVDIGFIQVQPNTITTAVTIIAGVTSINNGSTPYQIGTNQETDANFRLRRQASVSTPAQASIDGLYGALNDLPNMSDAEVYENDTSSTVNGIPAHGIWVVVNGGTPVQIAQLIYNYRCMGTPMKGSQSYVITQADGTNVTMYWDNVVLQNLYVTAFLQTLDGSSINISAITASLVLDWLFTLNQSADITTLSNYLRSINPELVCSALGVSTDGIHFYNVVTPSSQQNQFVLLAANINLQLYP